MKEICYKIGVYSKKGKKNNPQVLEPSKTSSHFYQ